MRVDWILSIALWSAGELSPIPSGHAPNASGVKTSAFGSAGSEGYTERLVGMVESSFCYCIHCITTFPGENAVWLHQPASKEYNRKEDPRIRERHRGGNTSGT